MYLESQKAKKLLFLLSNILYLAYDDTPPDDLEYHKGPDEMKDREAHQTYHRRQCELVVVLQGKLSTCPY